MTPRRPFFPDRRTRARTTRRPHQPRRGARAVPATLRESRSDAVAAWLMTRGLWAVLLASTGIAAVARLAMLGEGEILED